MKEPYELYDDYCAKQDKAYEKGKCYQCLYSLKEEDNDYAYCAIIDDNVFEDDKPSVIGCQHFYKVD